MPVVKQKVITTSVKIKKSDSETNAALAGASFDVIRTSTNETVKSVTTDANGEALIDGLLTQKYKLVETKAQRDTN